MNQILFSHNDLDGVGCGVIFKKAFGVLSEVNYVGNHRVDRVIQQRLGELESNGTFPTIYITDISPNDETAELLNIYPGEVFLFDHHETAKWLTDKYPGWATVVMGISGTKLLFDALVEQGDVSSYEDFVYLVNDYDMWLHRDPRSNELNRLFYILGVERFETRMILDSDSNFTATEMLLLELEDETIERYANKVDSGMIQFEWNGEPFCGIAFADRYQSEIGHELMERNQLELVAMVDVNTRKVSLRSKGSINVSSIAKRLGGGGHRNASGYSLGKNDSILPEQIWRVITATHELVESEELMESFGGGGQ